MPMTKKTPVLWPALAVVALFAQPANTAQSWELSREQDALFWSLTAASRCPKVDRRYLDGTCVQLVTKVAGGLIKNYVPEPDAMVKALLEIYRCERGRGSAGSTAPFLASCVERNGEAATRGFETWRELRAKAPDVPKGVPDAPLPQGDSLFK